MTREPIQIPDRAWARRIRERPWKGRWRFALLVNTLSAPVSFFVVLASIAEPRFGGGSDNARFFAAIVTLAIFFGSLAAWRVSVVSGAVVQIALLLPVFVILARTLRPVGYFSRFAGNMQHLSDGAVDGTLILRLVALVVIPACLILVCVIALMRARRNGNGSGL